MTRLKIVLISMLLGFTANAATAETTLDRRVDQATEVIQQFTRIPEKGIPSSLLNSAYAIAVGRIAIVTNLDAVATLTLDEVSDLNYVV